MNRSELLQIMKIDRELNKACQLLNTDRENVIPVMSSFLQVVNLGITVGRSMGTADQPSTPKNGHSASKKNGHSAKKVNGSGRTEKVFNIFKQKMKKDQTISDLLASVSHLLKDSPNPKGYVTTFLSEHKKDFKRVSRGVYRNR